MAKERFGVTLSAELVDELAEMVGECDNLGASRFEIVEAVLTASFKSDVDHVGRVR